MTPYSLHFKEKIELHKQKNKLLAKLRKNKSKKINQRQIDVIDRQIQEIDAKLDNFQYFLQQYSYKRSSYEYNQEESSIQIERLINHENQLQFSGKILVTLNLSSHCKKIVKLMKKNVKEEFWFSMYKAGIFKSYASKKLERFFYRGQMIKSQLQFLLIQNQVVRAAEPSDIIWKNIGTCQQKRKTRIIIDLIIIFIFLLSFGILVGIKRAIKKEQTNIHSQLIAIGLSFVASTVVALTNTSIGIILRKFAGLETHKKQTNYFRSVGKGLSYLFFINMVCTTLFANLFSFDEISNNKTTGFPFNLDGLINDFFFLFITNTYLSSIFNYFDIVWGYKLFKRYQAIKQGNFCTLSQREANELFEGHPIDIGLRYANVIKLMFFTAAVSPFIPMGLPMSLLGLVILYWVDKYLLLRRYTCHYYINSSLSQEMMNLLSLYTVFFSFGNIFVMCIPVIGKKSLTEFSFPDFYSSQYFYFALIGFLISIIYRYIVKLPMIRDLYYHAFQIKIPNKKIKATYQEQKLLLENDYDKFHPVLQDNFLPSFDDYYQKKERVVAPKLLSSIRDQLK